MPKVYATHSNKVTPPDDYTMTLYSEKIGPATVSICKNAGLWTVQLIDPSANIEREKIYYPSAYEDYESETYGRAITFYDQTCDAAARIHQTPRPLPEAPNFKKTVNI